MKFKEHPWRSKSLRLWVQAPHHTPCVKRGNKRWGVERWRYNVENLLKTGAAFCFSLTLQPNELWREAPAPSEPVWHMFAIDGWIIHLKYTPHYIYIKRNAVVVSCVCERLLQSVFFLLFSILAKNVSAFKLLINVKNQLKIKKKQPQHFVETVQALLRQHHAEGGGGGFHLAGTQKLMRV